MNRPRRDCSNYILNAYIDWLLDEKIQMEADNKDLKKQLKKQLGYTLIVAEKTRNLLDSMK